MTTYVCVRRRGRRPESEAIRATTLARFLLRASFLPSSMTTPAKAVVRRAMAPEPEFRDLDPSGWQKASAIHRSDAAVGHRGAKPIWGGLGHSNVAPSRLAHLMRHRLCLHVGQAKARSQKGKGGRGGLLGRIDIVHRRSLSIRFGPQGCACRNESNRFGSIDPQAQGSDDRIAQEGGERLTQLNPVDRPQVDPFNIPILHLPQPTHTRRLPLTIHQPSLGCRT